MKHLLILKIFLFSFLLGHAQWGNKDELKLFLHIKDFENKPIESCIVTIETTDQRQNSRYGKYSEKFSFNNYDKNDSIFEVILSKSRYKDRDVSISIFDTRNMESYIKRWIQEYDVISDKQEIYATIERDEEAYKNRKSKVYFSGQIFKFLNPPLEEYFKDIYKSSFSGEIYTEDFDKEIKDTAIVSFTIDTNCNITNRKIIKKIDGLRTELENMIMTQLEIRLKELNEKKYSCKEIEVTGLNILWGQE
jgi:hypothetical protein